jgi:predicted GNAT family acetyltransferase
VRVDRYTDAGAFLTSAGSWLASAEVENNVVLTTAGSIADGTRALKQQPYFGAAVDGERIVCCGMRTPPHRFLVTGGSVGGAEALSADAFEVVGRLPGVVGPREAAAAFAGAWLALAGGTAELSMRQSLQKIDRVNADPPDIQGRLRAVDVTERSLAVQWASAFAREAIPDAPSEAEESVDRHLRGGTLYFWDVGGPVAMCSSPGGTAMVARINLVYTPPSLRRRGYATAAVSALTRQLLSSGRRYCCLYTDLSNPTSNSVYHRIGYRPVCDIDQYTFAHS